MKVRVQFDNYTTLAETSIKPIQYQTPTQMHVVVNGDNKNMIVQLNLLRHIQNKFKTSI